MNLGLGYRPDPLHRRTQKDVRHLLGGAVAPAPDRDLTPFEAPIFDQLGYEGCLGHGTAQGIVVALGAAGLSLGFVPSPLGIWTLTRCIDNADPDAPLANVGGIPADTMQAISTFGVEPMGPVNPAGNTDCTDANILVKPPLLDLEKDADALIVGEYRIDETDPGVALAVRDLIGNKGVPVGIGAYVGPEYQAWNNPGAFAPVNVGGPNHWQCVVGTRTESDGSYSFKIVNSWGAGWCQQGHIWVKAPFLSAPNTSDLYALTVRRAS